MVNESSRALLQEVIQKSAATPGAIPPAANNIVNIVFIICFTLLALAAAAFAVWRMMTKNKHRVLIKIPGTHDFFMYTKKPVQMKNGKWYFGIGKEDYLLSDKLIPLRCMNQRKEVKLVLHTYHPGDPDELCMQDPRSDKKKVDLSAGETKAAYDSKIFTDLATAMSKGGGIDWLSLIAGIGVAMLLVVILFVMKIIEVVPKVAGK
jgi:hypothetical protein